MTTPREDHMAVKPPQDGSVLLQTTDGEEHTHVFSHDNTWSQEPFGIVFREYHPAPTRPERIVFPWTNILHFEVYPNSASYHQLMLQWLKDCDHDWLTHPRVGHYCRHCRLDMADMVNLYDDKIHEVPGLVSKAEFVDREAVEHDPTSEALPAVQDRSAGLGAIAVTIAVMGDPADFCECDDDTTPHAGPCRQNPTTWPTAIVDPDEEGNGQF